MAADTLESSGGVDTGRVKKIMRRADGALAAASGHATVCRSFLKLFESGAPLTEFRPQLKESDGGFSALVASAEGNIFYMDEHGSLPLDCEFAACGCAHDMLIGAMAHGASAEEAVAIATKYDRRCGGEVQVEHIAQARSA